MNYKISNNGVCDEVILLSKIAEKLGVCELVCIDEFKEVLKFTQLGFMEEVKVFIDMLKYWDKLLEFKISMPFNILYVSNSILSQIYKESYEIRKKVDWEAEVSKEIAEKFRNLRYVEIKGKKLNYRVNENLFGKTLKVPSTLYPLRFDDVKFC